MTPQLWQTRMQELRQQGALPRHVAIIMDGNGRWARMRNRPRLWGHQQGVESVRSVVEAAGELGLEALTLYAFSDENWGRPNAEVAGIMALLGKYVVRERQALDDNNVRLLTIGCLEKIPARVRKLVVEAEAALAKNTGLTLTIALSYGAKNEIAHACRAIAEKVARGELTAQAITPDVIESHLWTSGLPDPDLLIRTSGEQRLSNFLLWQMAYTELWFTNLHWPDFRKQHFYEALSAYQQRRRRFGLVEEGASDRSAAFLAERMHAQSECRSESC